MEKNTILAVVLSTVVIFGFYMIQGVFFPKQPVQPTAQQQPPVTASPQGAEPQQMPGVLPAVEQTQQSQQTSSAQAPTSPDMQMQLDAGPQEKEYLTINTNLLTVVLSNEGGSMVSWKLNEHEDSDGNVNMIFGGSEEARAFSIAFGGLDARPVNSLFYMNRLGEHSVEFYRDFSMPGASITGEAGQFRLIKRYDFKPNDYMFELTITLDGGYSMTGFNFYGNAYTLSFGPQIGPRFEKLNDRYDFRQYITFLNGKVKKAKPNDVIDTRPTWAAISGKYFVFMAIPYLAQYNVSFSERAEPGLPTASRFNLIRPAASASRVADTYRFYMGPKTQDALVIYNTGKNEFGLKDMNLVEAASSRGILSPLEKALKWLLLLFYKIIPNYGVAIILLTLLVKILFFPLTKKGSVATFRMQALAPKIKEIQEKYKNNPQKLRVEMGNFYSKEGYNPISGCLPMLLQIPIFFAMYNLFNNHFDLRGAEFIPGWIPDLSVPEAIVNFPEGVTLPFLGWTALRLLPFIYVGSQLVYGKVTQMPGQQSNSQMKMMMYVMPIVFFFVLYNMPSGLLVYWIFSNILTMGQQLIINKYVLKKQMQQATETQPVIVPTKKKNK